MFQDILLTITGTKEIYVENYKCLLDYKENLIALQGKKETLLIRGEDFLIDYFAGDGMKIKGCVTSVEFIKTSNQVGRR